MFQLQRTLPLHPTKRWSPFWPLPRNQPHGPPVYALVIHALACDKGCLVLLDPWVWTLYPYLRNKDISKNSWFDCSPPPPKFSQMQGQFLLFSFTQYLWNETQDESTGFQWDSLDLIKFLLGTIPATCKQFGRKSIPTGVAYPHMP